MTFFMRGSFTLQALLDLWMRPKLGRAEYILLLVAVGSLGPSLSNDDLDVFNDLVGQRSPHRDLGSHCTL